MNIYYIASVCALFKINGSELIKLLIYNKKVLASYSHYISALTLAALV